MADELLDFRQGIDIIFTGKTDRITVFADTCSTTDSVHIIFRILWQVIVKNMTDIRDMQAARRYISGNQYRQFTALKFL